MILKIRFEHRSSPMEQNTRPGLSNTVFIPHIM